MPTARTRILGLALLAACAPAAEDTGPVRLPPEDTSVFREDTGTFPFDTSDTGVTDEVPAHLLTIRHGGAWLLGGDRGDPTSVTGTLVVTEVLDGADETPACTETFALVGERADADCAGCTATFRVLHTLVAGAGTCRSPERPEDTEERTLGYDAGAVWWDWYDTGVWVPLWEVEPGDTSDEIVFTWETTMGVIVEDME
jgi:hypothetical protein